MSACPVSEARHSWWVCGRVVKVVPVRIDGPTVTPEELAALLELARDQVVLELGAGYGYSTQELSSVAARVWSVDWHHGDPQAGEGDTLAGYLGRVRLAQLSGRVISVVGRFDSVLPLLQPASFGLIFHDGYHERAAVEADLRMARPLLSWAGAIAVHDYGLFDVEPATQSVLGPPHEVRGRLAIWRSMPGRSHI
jgi:Methyltransferase domain